MFFIALHYLLEKKRRTGIIFGKICLGNVFNILMVDIVKTYIKDKSVRVTKAPRQD